MQKKDRYNINEINTLNIIISGLDSGGLGGSESFLVNLSDELNSKGANTVFLTVAGSDLDIYLKANKKQKATLPFRQDVIGDWKGVVKFIILLIPALVLSFKLLYQYKKKGFNCILIPGFSDKIILTPLARLFGMKVVWVEYAPLDALFRKHLHLPEFLYRIVLHLSQKILVPTKNTKKHLIRLSNTFKGKIHIISLGIKLLSDKKIEKERKSSQHIRKDREWEDKFVVGVISRLEKEKGQDHLITAVDKLVSKIKNIHLVIIGEGETEYLKMIARKLKMRNVEFLGYIPEKHKYAMVSAFDVFCFPTRWELEGFGLVVLEAMMMGTPIVASDFGPVPEVVGDAGLLVKPNADDIAKGILKMKSDKKLQKELVKNGKNRIKSFDVRITAEEYLKVFGELFK